jgi:hypothetical protein
MQQQGGWEEGEKSGNGMLLHPSGASFEGTFAAGTRGPGTFRAPDGSVVPADIAAAKFGSHAKEIEEESEAERRLSNRKRGGGGGGWQRVARTGPTAVQPLSSSNRTHKS